jgi:hypothetical protein
MKSLVALLVFSCGAQLLISQSSNGHLRGSVADHEDASIGDAIVLIHWSGRGADAKPGSPAGLTEDLRIRTDKSGKYSAELAPGFYDIAVFATGFTPRALKVRLRGGEPTLSNIKLEVDPLMCAEFCENLGTSEPETQPTKPK